MEIVHVQLPNKGAEIVVLEVLRKDLFGEGDLVLNGEAIAVGEGPVSNVVRVWIVHNFIQFYQKTRNVVNAVGD